MSKGQKLHIISFDVPYPPDYGGVIDVFYKLKALSEEGVQIFLHCFQYGREISPELKKYCADIFCYPRKKGIIHALKQRPYIVETREHPELLNNLLKVKAPILFEGLHTCALAMHPELAGYRKIVRMHNVEHEYYSNLASADSGTFVKFHFQRESKKLKQYERQIIRHADILITISPSDQKYFKGLYPDSVMIPAFHSFEKISSKSGRGTYFLYHGNLSVAENKKAVEFLLNGIFNQLPYNLIIAGKNPPSGLLKRINRLKNISVRANPAPDIMKDLIENAQACVIPTFQPTGLKLKLLASLYEGRFCITNPDMAGNTGLERVCILAESPEEFREAVATVAEKNFTSGEIQERTEVLEASFSNKANIKKLLNRIY